MNILKRVAFCWRILRETRADELLEKVDFELATLNCFGELHALFNDNVKELMLVFLSQRHSGLSAAVMRDVLSKLLAHEPITPLTGEPHEWVEVGTGVFQNRRCGRVFKTADRFNGRAYDIEGVVFVEKNGACYTSKESATPITFPYTPSNVYVNAATQSE